MPKYEVAVVRTVTESLTVEVVAKDEQEARNRGYVEAWELDNIWNYVEGDTGEITVTEIED
jgi:hypothetical protein